MRITDDTDETFAEDMRYMRMLMDRIFRTAITQGMVEELDVISHDVESELVGGELEAAVIELDAATGPARAANGRFVKG